MLLPDPCTPAIDAVLQMAPCAAFSAGTATCAQRNGPIRLVVRILDQKSSVSASRSENGIGVGVAGVPALLTRKSSRPSASIALVTIRSASPGRDTSPGVATIRRPSAFSRSTAAGPRACGRRVAPHCPAEREKVFARGEADARGGSGPKYRLAAQFYTDHVPRLGCDRNLEASMGRALRLSSRPTASLPSHRSKEVAR